MRPVVSIDDTIDFLNSLARKDNECIKKLCLHRELCNDSIVNDKLAEYGLDGIKYNACEPDFSPVSVDSVKIDNMSSDLIANKNIAYKQFAEKWSSEGFQGKTDWTPRDVEKYKKDNNLDFHECGDMKTCQLVPHEIHSYFKHAAGRCACKIIEKGGMAFDA